MNVKVVGEKIQLDLFEIVQEVARKNPAAVIETIVTVDDVVKCVVDQLVNGCTDDGSYCSDLVLRSQRQRIIESTAEFKEMRERDLKYVERSGFSDGFHAGVWELAKELYGESFGDWPDRVKRATEKDLIGRVKRIS